MKTNKTFDDALSNHLLEALPAEDFARIEGKLQSVTLELGQVLYEVGDTMEHIYFPTTAIVSLLYVMVNGNTAEIGIAGNNGLIGTALYMGGGATTNRAVVQRAGRAVRMKTADMKAEFKLAGVFQTVLLKYAQFLMTQISQTAVCNRLHSIQQQLWSLATDES